ncbi:MAG: HAMP domain-containing histidine kinase [Chitinophagaceae bacterium]|nr:HAMP domain-containing histidine kinase [Chitinophagaceae bacterium]
MTFPLLPKNNNKQAPVSLVLLAEDLLVSLADYAMAKDVQLVLYPPTVPLFSLLPATEFGAVLTTVIRYLINHMGTPRILALHIQAGDQYASIEVSGMGYSGIDRLHLYVQDTTDVYKTGLSGVSAWLETNMGQALWYDSKPGTGDRFLLRVKMNG